MKNFFKKLSFIALFGAICGSIASCGPQEEQPGVTGGDFAIEVKEVGADYVDILVSAPSTLEMSYMVSEEPILTTAAVLFKEDGKGTIITVNHGDVVRVKNGVVQDKDYYLYACAKLNSMEYSPILCVTFKTKKYEFSETVTVVETYYDGFKVHVAVPAEVKAKGNVLRYGATSLAMYNKATQLYGTQDVDRLIGNGNVYGRYIKNDSTLVFNHDNIYEKNPDGSIYKDPDTGEPWDIHDPIAPGEPCVFLVGEFEWAETSQEIEDKIGIAGWKPAYILPMYDFMSDTWTGEFVKKEFRAKEPALLNAEINIEVSDISPIDANIYIDIDDNVYQYIYAVMDVNTYNAMLGLCGGNEDYIQWFLTSYLALFELGVEAQYTDLEINAASHFTEPLAAGEDYVIVLTALGDAEGTTQKFVKKEFTAAKATKPRPVIEVTPVPSDDPYLATFNIKAGKDSKGNVQHIIGAYYGANYAREWQLMFNQKYTYETILKGNYYFGAEDLAKINSEEGLNFSVYTLDGETTRMAVYGYNDEYTFNQVDPVSVADYTSPYAPAKPAVAGYEALVAQLEGEWTATATIKANMLIDGTEDQYDSYLLDHKSKVVFSGSVAGAPNPVPAYVYDLYSGMSKDEVDGMLEELDALAAIFTENRLANQNRILASGFIDFDYHKNPGRLDWRSPFDLFVATDYTSVDIPQVFYDFGPKWYLEVLEDGSVIVPFSSTLMPPMHNWPGYPYYVSAYDGGQYFFYDANEEHPGFPVEISQDKIVIKPMEINGQKYYMNAAGFSQEAVASQSADIIPVLSEIVLTRGWTEPVAPAAIEPASVRAAVQTIDGSQAAMPIVRQVRSMTKFVEPKVYVVDEQANFITFEKFDQAMTEAVKKYYNIK